MALFIKNSIKYGSVQLSCIMKYATETTLKTLDPGIAGLGKVTAKKAVKTGTGKKSLLPVETDTNKLVNYVCGSNILREGGEDVKIKPDSEYPEWLWNIRTGKAPTLEELDPNTLEYWKKVRKMGRRKVNYLKSVKPFHPFLLSVKRN